MDMKTGQNDAALSNDGDGGGNDQQDAAAGAWISHRFALLSIAIFVR